MNDRAQRNVAQLERVAGFDIRSLAGFDFGADRKAFGRKDVSLLAVGVVEQRDIRRSIRIVFERRNDRRYSVLVALEIDQAKPSLVTAATMTNRHAALIVATAGSLDRNEQALFRFLFRQPGKIGDLHEALAGRARI